MSDPADPAVWFIRSRGREFGPLTGAALRSAAAEGRVGPADAVRKTGGPWRPSTEVKGLLPDPPPPSGGSELAGMLAAAPDAAPPPAPPAARSADPPRPATPPATASPVAAEPPAPPADPDRITAADLAAAGVAEGYGPAAGLLEGRAAGLLLQWGGLFCYFAAALMVAGAVVVVLVAGGAVAASFAVDPPSDREAADAEAGAVVTVLFVAAAALYAVPLAVTGWAARHLADRPGERTETAARVAGRLLVLFGAGRLAWLWLLAPYLAFVLGVDFPGVVWSAGHRFKGDMTPGATANAAELLTAEVGAGLMAVVGVLLLGYAALVRSGRLTRPGRAG